MIQNGNTSGDLGMSKATRPAPVPYAGPKRMDGISHRSTAPKLGDAILDAAFNPTPHRNSPTPTGTDRYK